MNPYLNKIRYKKTSFESMTFLSILPFFRANLAISKKRIILEGWSLDKVHKKHVNFLSQMSFFKAHWTHCRNRLVTNDSVWFRNGCSPAAYFQNTFSVATFLFRLFPFVDCFYSTLSILLFGENSSVKGLLKFSFRSCFRKQFPNFFRGYRR